ncbi:hypothetical protein A2392_01345 [Candidatus Kaiserbacteria bacterium RIFOXYB1_FULL_46_14]|uniref:Uncharacterized protein n=1 Tax=Candidatus Kaiserbacteria bacterium RIFOXYB1_FULL_46_14 TaxID=1798531 RepID=A0A1F6FJP5_9BACT|nr:MAG: hypothetical protein A2392_01345 [Candidatus Kaiserbacteria bacterium RIFOXYB1_FULL_46_14]
MYKIRNYVLAAILGLVGLWFAGMVTESEAGSRCRDSVRVHDRCGPAPNTKYKGGGRNPKTVKVTVCLPDDLAAAIRRKNGESWWDFGLYYGNGRPEEVRTVRTNCKRQNITPGTWAVAYIDCPGPNGYVGWVNVRVSASDRGRTLTLRRGSPFKSASHNPL